MSTISHLKRAVEILRSNFCDEIEEELTSNSGQFTWNLKNWTIQFYEEECHKSVTAYRVENNLTNWSDYITLEEFKREWEAVA
ncbi:hypothetical protein [Polynucleobacter sp. MG-27-Goln-C1]|uniref:hypothetical protein n=1 Tax=Polynucleobacter sp. MG-27-Goln-C1 TaxID=1819726 RepID=UPI001C0AE8CA|nr:hypothetical protein [Polynucleobacter sp. MG-27-Goln-C1]MBU3613198.1 hypothetical protein [Polynucleobacter sp. MG-27-Goln-C1]